MEMLSFETHGLHIVDFCNIQFVRFDEDNRCTNISIELGIRVD